MGAPLDDALAAGNKARVDYYNARLGMLADRGAVFPVVRAMAEGKCSSLPRAEAALAVDQARYDGGHAIEQAIRHGVLTLDDEGCLSFGIPSFHTHMGRLLAERERRQQALASGPTRLQWRMSWRHGCRSGPSLQYGFGTSVRAPTTAAR